MPKWYSTQTNLLNGSLSIQNNFRARTPLEFTSINFVKVKPLFWECELIESAWCDTFILKIQVIWLHLPNWWCLIIIGYFCTHSKNEPYTFANFRWKNGEQLFCQNGSRECLRSSKRSEILRRCHRSMPENVVDILWVKNFQINF